MQRLYFLSPDIDKTVKIARELEELGLTKDEVHVMGRNWKGLEDRGVNSATLMQTSDLANAATRGLKLGIPLGLALGVIVYFVLDFTGIWSFLGSLVGMGIFGALFGLWTSSMIGVSVRDVKIDKYRRQIDYEGAYLMMVDVPQARVKDIEEAVRRHHPDVRVETITRTEKERYGAGA